MPDRPLIPFLISFTGGILVAHKLLSSCEGPIFPVFFCIAIFLSGSILLPGRSKMVCLFTVFFFTGALLDMLDHHPSQLLSLALRHKHFTIEGTILEPARVMDQMARLKVHTHRLFINGQPLTVNEKITVTVYNHIPNLSTGQKIRFPARLKPFKNFNNPGQYDYKSDMELRGFTCAAYVSDGRSILSMGEGDLPFHRKLMEKVQRPVRDFFSQNLSPEINALYRAIILGECQGINDELREPFNRTGLGHLLAVSGFNIALVAWISFFLFRWVLSRSYVLALRINIRKLAALLTCLPVLGYLFIAGLQVPCQRAMIMGIAYLCSLILDRENEVWSTLALAGLLILATDPHAIFQVSFQLSFSAVIGILWLTPPILRKIPSPDKTGEKTIPKYIYSYFVDLLAVCLSATIFLLPLITLFFHQIPLATIPANFVAVPIIGLWVMPLGLLAAIALPFSATVAEVSLQLGAWGMDLMMGIIRFLSNLLWASFWTVTPNNLEILLFYLLTFFVFFIRRWKWAKAGALAVTVVLLADVGYWVSRVSLNNELRVSFLDVGQANAALVEFPFGQKMLIDGGGFPDDRFDVGRMVVAPFLWQSKILRIDYLVLSHPQSDHMNGLRFIAKAFHPKEFWYNGDEVETLSFKELIGIVDEEKIRKCLPAELTKGREINGARVDILHPEPGDRPLVISKSGAELNNRSLVVKISYAGKTFLFPGDLEAQGEEVLISNSAASLKSDVLLAPHHGSKSSSSREFLGLVQPAICVISSGQSNFFGFPHQQTIERLQNIHCKIIRIDEVGAVWFRVRQNQFEPHSFLEKDTASLSEPGLIHRIAH